ncbi:MAG: hypothetical protein RLY70_2248 [Planctomycetota bacterium]|jgi:hypothetical protein
MLAIDPLHTLIALAPLAFYALTMAYCNLMRRPVLLTGARDAALLGVAVSGLVAAGPMELFMPEAAALRFHSYIWVLLAVFYLLCLALIVLVIRPRLVVYNISKSQIRRLVTETASRLDNDSRWAGDCLVLPNRGVQLYLETSSWLRNAQLIATGPRQDYAGWRLLELELSETLRGTRRSRNPHGYLLLATSISLAATAVIAATYDSVLMARLVRDLFRE